MKIAYLNGYNGENSDKASKLSNILEKEVHHVVYNHKEFNYDTLKEELKDFDLIIASSTGAYIARNICFDYNIPLISLNPVVNLSETFDILNDTKPEVPTVYFNKSLEELILINLDDELINPLNTIELSKAHNIQYKSFKSGGHRFQNLEETKNTIEDFMRSSLFLAPSL